MVALANRSAPIAARIFAIRGVKVILDSDLAQLYEVPTKTLLQAIRRNQERFPRDFHIVLSNQELACLRSQVVTSKPAGRGGRRYAVHAFTEHGAIMAATVLNSRRAVRMSIYVVRAFLRMREALGTNWELGARLQALVLQAVRELAAQPEPA